MASRSCCIYGDYCTKRMLWCCLRYVVDAALRRDIILFLHQSIIDVILLKAFGVLETDQCRLSFIDRLIS